ncbi:winged helix-turn-helix transcriptional regulator [Anaerocolumna sp.]|uniref:winged helix-turn-helix transcriptional regulator n=1 Tax=Anaerocolumna sp. TaxID=2041569 RepID=UPI0028A914C6|nr:winged helix-turn-helix transcriptional regulator [Anaerocolumna sp.]
MKNLYNLPCNVAQTLNIIGDKWTLLILRQIMIGRKTYKEMQEGLEGIPSNLLSERLKCLETDGLITTRLYQNHPPRYEYLLTDSGKDLGDIFYSIIMWGEKHLKVCYKQLTHSECGHKIVHQYFCPHCNKIIQEDEINVSAPKQNEEATKNSAEV